MRYIALDHISWILKFLPTIRRPEQNIAALQSLTGKYRGLQGNPCNENRFFPVSCTGFGFAVHISKKNGDLYCLVHMSGISKCLQSWGFQRS